MYVAGRSVPIFRFGFVGLQSGNVRHIVIPGNNRMIYRY